MSTRLTKGPVTILAAAAATGSGASIPVGDFRHKNIAMSVVGQDNGADVIIVKCKGSDSIIAPDFDAAQSATNSWDTVTMIDLQDSSAFDGDTGITFTNSNTTRHFSVNADGLRWITLDVTTYTDANTSGSITATLTAFDDA